MNRPRDVFREGLVRGLSHLLSFHKAMKNTVPVPYFNAGTEDHLDKISKDVVQPAGGSGGFAAFCTNTVAANYAACQSCEVSAAVMTLAEAQQTVDSASPLAAPDSGPFALPTSLPAHLVPRALAPSTAPNPPPPPQIRIRNIPCLPLAPVSARVYDSDFKWGWDGWMYSLVRSGACDKDKDLFRIPRTFLGLLHRRRTSHTFLAPRTSLGSLHPLVAAPRAHGYLSTATPSPTPKAHTRTAHAGIETYAPNFDLGNRECERRDRPIRRRGFGTTDV
ncbi:hypothetical protein FB451DRAFT_1164766 [Mycena latifolia]|nr:hypothetical protein FB451DRAFT_1164741 [Mycena latifolia]KAJ7493898.1 hypothetical protein FB451DRAFT_1164766 [Mycena latifolia]